MKKPSKINRIFSVYSLVLFLFFGFFFLVGFIRLNFVDNGLFAFLISSLICIGLVLIFYFVTKEKKEKRCTKKRKPI